MQSHSAKFVRISTWLIWTSSMEWVQPSSFSFLSVSILGWTICFLDRLLLQGQVKDARVVCFRTVQSLILNYIMQSGTHECKSLQSLFSAFSCTKQALGWHLWDLLVNTGDASSHHRSKMATPKDWPNSGQLNAHFHTSDSKNMGLNSRRGAHRCDFILIGLSTESHPGVVIAQADWLAHGYTDLLIISSLGPWPVVAFSEASVEVECFFPRRFSMGSIMTHWK